MKSYLRMSKFEFRSLNQILGVTKHLDKIMVGHVISDIRDIGVLRSRRQERSRIHIYYTSHQTKKCMDANNSYRSGYQPTFLPFPPTSYISVYYAFLRRHCERILERVVWEYIVLNAFSPFNPFRPSDAIWNHAQKID